MATEVRRTDPPLAKILFDEAYRFDFFQAVRVLERIHTDRAPVGRMTPPGDEVTRFRTHPSLEFPASQIHEIDRTRELEEGGPPQMIVAFMGLIGPLGILPNYYTELVRERARYKDTALWEFVDLFNHRLISLFYRAWEKYRFPVAYERGELDRFTEYLYDIIGLGTRGLRGDRLGVPDEGLLYYGGLIAQRPHSVSAIAAILGDHFGVPAKIVQFSGQWLQVEDADRSRLGVANHVLGVSMVIGARVWDDQSKFRVRFGPLTLDQFSALLPAGAAHRPAAGVARLLAGAEFDFDFQLILKAREVPGCVLTTRAKRRPMLGWTTWLKTKPFANDDEQVILAAGN